MRRLGISMGLMFTAIGDLMKSKPNFDIKTLHLKGDKGNRRLLAGVESRMFTIVQFGPIGDDQYCIIEKGESLPWFSEDDFKKVAAEYEKAKLAPPVFRPRP